MADNKSCVERPSVKPPNLNIDKLISISMGDIYAVPNIIYKGKKIENIIKVGMNWETNTESPGRASMYIDYYEVDGLGNSLRKQIKLSKGLSRSHPEEGEYVVEMNGEPIPFREVSE